MPRSDRLTEARREGRREGTAGGRRKRYRGMNENFFQLMGDGIGDRSERADERFETPKRIIM